jgi:chemotaxis protein methyltransferase CheR
VHADSVPEALWPRLSDFIARETGLHFPPERRPDLQRGLADAAAELGFVNAAACARWLLSDRITQPQLDTVASHLTIGETYFFRDRKTFDALRNHLLPQLVARRRGQEQRLRLWSAACSTGEEAYSLAIAVQQALPDWKDWNISILGSDINTRFLQKAVRGVYGDWSFRDAPPELKERYFTRIANGRYEIAPNVRGCVKFAQLNLAQDGIPSLATDTNAMDIIFCRNVLLYFTPLQARKLVGKLRHALLDDGWLAVSATECSQELFSDFAAVNFPGAILYRAKPFDEVPTHRRVPHFAEGWLEALPPRFADVNPPSAAGAATAESTVAPATETHGSAPNPIEFLDTAEALFADGHYGEAAETLLSSLDATGRRLPSLQLRAFALLTRALANQGRLADALAWNERWLVVDKLNAAAHYLHAMVSQELGKTEQARRSLQRAVYLRPDFAVAHFALGNLDERGSRANKHFANALRLLRQRPPEELVPESDGLTSARLSEIIVALLLSGEPAVENIQR